MDLQGALNAVFDPVNGRLLTSVITSPTGRTGEDANAVGNAVSGGLLQLVVGTATGTGGKDANGAWAAVDAGNALRAVVVAGTASAPAAPLDMNGILRNVIDGDSIRVILV